MRIVKQVEAIFKTMPVELPEFSHYAPAEWLLRNPQILDGTAADVSSSLDRFEAAFKAVNAFL